MHEKISERSRGMYPRRMPYACLTFYLVLDDRIDEFAELVRIYYDLEEIGDPMETTSVSTDVMWRFILNYFPSRTNASLWEEYAVM